MSRALSRWPADLPAPQAHEAAAWAMAATVALGPLELRDAMVPLFGLRVSSVEVLAALAIALGAWATLRGGRLGDALRRPVTWALVLWAGVHVASAAWSDAPGYSLKFGLRVAGGVCLALTCAVLGAHQRFRRIVGIGVLAGLAGITAIAVAERAVGQELEPFLQLFRDEPTWMLGEPRVSTVFYHANTLAAFLELTLPFLVVASCLPALPPGVRRGLLFWSLLGAAMLSLTYSRAGLLAGVLAALLLGWLAGQQPLRRRAWIFAGLLSVAYLANPDMRARLGFGERSYRVAYAFDGPCEGDPGTEIEVPVTVTNTGEWPLSDRHAPGELGWLIWPREGPPHPAAFRYLPLPDLDRGETFDARLRVHLPDIPGPWDLVVDIRRKSVIWLSATGADLGRTTCTVHPRAGGTVAGDPRPPSVPIQLQTRPVELARRHYWRAALELMGQRPLLGLGADRFRMRYRERVPDKAWDGRARAHSIVLETAANLGLLGLLALGLLVGAALGVARQLLRGPPAPLSLAAFVACAGFGLHSMVDYFLGYTQILLIAWPILGLAIAIPEQRRRGEPT